MSVPLRTPEEIEKLRIAGKLASDVLVMLEPHIKPGVTTGFLDDLCMDYITNTQHAISACLNYHGYPKCTCISVNEEVCHGIPGKRILKEGDIVNVDVTVIKDGYYGDTSKMFIVGSKVNALQQRLVQVTQKCLYSAMRTVYDGSDLADIGDVIQTICNRERFSIVRDYCGHGIGDAFHIAPTVLHYKNKDNMTLKAGMVFTIEPMINAGGYKVKVNRKDGWTVTTADKMPSAQFEHTILVTEDGCEVLTYRDEENQIERVMHNKPQA